MRVGYRVVAKCWIGGISGVKSVVPRVRISAPLASTPGVDPLMLESRGLRHGYRFLSVAVGIANTRAGRRSSERRKEST